MSNIEFCNISKREGDSVLIEDLNFDLKSGENISIKCSESKALLILDIITKKVKASSGKILVEDNEFYSSSDLAYIYREEGYYERMSVIEYLKFFKDLNLSELSVNSLIKEYNMTSIKNKRISSLNYSEKRRLSFARANGSNRKTIVVFEPLYNLDRESKQIILTNISDMNKRGISVLSFSTSLEDTLLVGGSCYILNDDGFKLIDEEKIENEEEMSELPKFKIDKIPAKVADKIILINPTEISYIEAENGITYIYYKDEKVSCTLTMTNLENRLKHLGFFRSHRSYLVNLQLIREVVAWTRNSYSLVLDDEKKSSIPLSKGRMDELKELLNL